jgi:hypothetical protein
MKTAPIQNKKSMVLYNKQNILLFSICFLLVIFVIFKKFVVYLILSKISTSRTVQEIPKTKVSDFFKTPPPPKICDVLSDVLRESITGRICRTVRGQVKNHSPLTKQGKCWVLTARIADHTADVEVCFDSEVHEIKNKNAI